MKYLKYLSYIVRHKWFVGVAGRKIGLSWWQCITHDLSKMRPSEFFPYCDYFYGGPWATATEAHRASQLCGVALKTQHKVDEAFDKAWLKHQHRNPHHYQHWVLREDSGTQKILNMPYRYIKEMVADWMGAGRAITGKWDIEEWYEKNADKMELGSWTRAIVESILIEVEI